MNMRLLVFLEKRVVVVLNCFVIGSCYIVCGVNFGFLKFMVNVVKNEFCDILRRKVVSFIKFLKSEVEVGKVVSEFEDILMFFYVIGVLDGIYVKIIVLKENKYNFLGKKVFYSVFVLGVVDSNCKFIYVSVGFFGVMSFV